MILQRRHFNQLAMLTMANAITPRLSSATPDKQARKVGVAVVGLGSIAEVFMRSAGQTSNTRLSAFVTGHPDTKGKQYGAQYGVAADAIYTYGNYDLIRTNPSVDAVYIALPNSMHCEYTVRAAEAGKHVFCEKPMAVSSAECRRMIDACRSAGVVLMIGYRVHYDATFRKVRELIQSGAIGQVQACQAGFYGMKNKQEWRLKRSLAGGGSLLDLGIYPLNSIRWLLQENPTQYQAFVATRDRSGQFNEVEQSVEWLMKFPSGVLASCGSSYGQSGTNFIQMNGDKGYVRVEPAFVYGDAVLRITGHSLHGDLSGGGPVNDPDQFVSEISVFSDCVLKHQACPTPGEEGLLDLIAIEHIYAAAGSPIA